MGTGAARTIVPWPILTARDRYRVAARNPLVLSLENIGWNLCRPTGHLRLSIHRLSYFAFVGAFAHGLLAGTDFAQPVLGALAWLTAAVLVIVGFRRLTASRTRQSPARSKTVAIP